MSPTFGLTIPEFGLGGLLIKDAYKLAKDLYKDKGKNFPKGKVVDRIMAKAPRGPRGKQVIRKRTGFPKRQPVKRASSKRKRLAPRGKFKKPKKVRKIGTKYHNHRYEVEGTCNAGQPYMYVGINDCYKRAAIWDAMADALLRPILAKECKFYPLQDTDKIGNLLNSVAGNKRVIVFGFKRVSAISGAQTAFTGFDSDSILVLSRLDLDDVTYETMRTRMSYILSYWADNSAATAYFPHMYTTVSDTTTDVGNSSGSVISSFEHLGDTMIDLVFKQTTSFVNRTLAEGGGGEGQYLDRLGTNPLKGKLYQFNNAAPRVLDHVDMSTALRASIQSEPATGMDKYTSVSAADILANSHLAHPLSSKFWLKNCAKESNILLQPGQTKSHSTVYKLKGKLSTLIERFYFAGFDKGTFGASSLFMFDMVHKSDQTPQTTYKRLCIVQSAGKLKSPKLYIPDFEAVTENL